MKFTTFLFYFSLSIFFLIRNYKSVISIVSFSCHDSCTLYWVRPYSVLFWTFHMQLLFICYLFLTTCQGHLISRSTFSYISYSVTVHPNQGLLLDCLITFRPTDVIILIKALGYLPPYKILSMNYASCLEFFF